MRLGQVYNGEPLKGVIFFTGYVGGYAMMLLALEDDVFYTDYYGDSRVIDVDSDDEGILLGALMLVSGWLCAVIDAPISSNRINKNNQRLIEQQRFSATPLMKPNRFGASLTFRW